MLNALTFGMNGCFPPVRRKVWPALVCLLILAATAFSAPAAPLNLEVRLIHVTDEEMTPASSSQRVEPLIAEKLRRLPFKWKHFYETSRKTISLPERGTNHMQLNPSYRLEMRSLDASRIEATLYNKKRLVNTMQQTLERGKLLIIGDDDKRTDAWLVIVRDVRSTETP